MAQRLTPLLRIEREGYFPVEVSGLSMPEVVHLLRDDVARVRTGQAAIDTARADARVKRVYLLGAAASLREPNNWNEREPRGCFGVDGRWAVLLPAFKVDDGEPGQKRVSARVELTVDTVTGAVSIVNCQGTECDGKGVRGNTEAPPPKEDSAPAQPRCLRKRPSFQLLCRGTMRPGDPDRQPATACDTCLTDRDCKGPGARCVPVGQVPCNGPARLECRVPSAECGGKICPEVASPVP
jgi:hypothetical protein